jgi:hypothetical protein
MLICLVSYHTQQFNAIFNFMYTTTIQQVFHCNGLAGINTTSLDPMLKSIQV